MRARDTHPYRHDVTPEGGRGVGKDVYRALGVVPRVVPRARVRSDGAKRKEVSGYSVTTLFKDI